MIKFARRVRPDILHDNVNVTREIEDFLTSISFVDNISAEPDTVSIAMSDREKKWRSAWRPKKGSVIKCALVVSSGWDGIKPTNRFIGTFEIDKFSISGTPKISTIEGLSIPQSSTLNRSQKTKAWEKTGFRKIAEDVAKANGMTLYFSAMDNPYYDRVDQEGETDLSFLMRLCSDAGLTLKVANKKLIIMDEAKLEEAPEKLLIKESDKAIKSYDGDDSLTSLYRSCSVKWTDPKTKKVKRYTFTPKHPPATNRVLYVNEEINSESAAKKLAMSKLRDANKNGMTFSIRFAGFLTAFAGETVRLEDFDAFDGKYIITSVSATVSKGSETTLSLRRVLEGY
ncbi:MAG: hypothetical protein F9K39_04395 [Exiguobacterium chiriqhucha]|nr:MAG: hypothetical protein F9K39_04395 [Exiguobacterium chiriqhucha]